MSNDLIELDGADLSATFKGIAKVSAFSTDGFAVDEISKSIKGADALALWLSGDKTMLLDDCKAVVGKIANCAKKDANIVWSAGFDNKKQVVVLAGWKPKRINSK